MRRGTALLACAVAACCVFHRAVGRQLSPNVSTTVFAGDEIHSRPPLAVLRADTPGVQGASLPLELKIFAEDPKWASQVEEFVVAAGADAQGVEGALNRVRDVSWAAGRTFRRKHVVLLAFAEDAESDGDEVASCRLVRAVKAASRHTTDAHFVLVADGFELDPVTREIMESVLDSERWRSFTTIEVPEFEGFSSAINRAAEAIQGNSIVAVLSTSALLLPAGSTADAPEAAPPTNGISSQESASDVFVAFEQIRSSWRPPGEETGDFLPRDDASRKNSGANGTRYDWYGHTRDPNDGGNENEGLLITILPSRLTALGGEDAGSSRQAQGGRGASSGEEDGEGRDRHEGAAEDPQPPPSTRLRDAAPLPLLVFDTETLSALGELDERFAFQGGVAEWISRATTLSSIEQDGAASAETGTSCCCNASPRRCRGSPAGEKRSKTGSDDPTGLPCSDGTAVQHVHAREWGKRFVGLWPDESARLLRSPLDEPDARRSGVDWHSGGDGQRGKIMEKQAFGPGAVADADEIGQPINSGDPRTTSAGVMVDQWTQLPPAKLEALVQADADLFFLPLLLLQHPSDAAPQGEAASARLCVAFHSEWMQRPPDKTLERDAVLRREKFPVAVVVVVHDDISLMRASLEGVAAVVELILVVVSATPWHGDAKDISPTLELLDEMAEDVGSPTHGKLKVEVGSWVTEAEQREYGSAVIREDPRNFSRVVVMDTDEFWHPVELAKALVLVAQQPEAVFVIAEMNTFWASVRSVVSPPESLRVVWLIDPRRCWWHAYRVCWYRVQNGREDSTTFSLDRSLGVMHHLSYVRVGEDLRRKMGTFSHAGEEESGWYKRSWLGWAANNSLTDLHPTHPEAYKRVAVQPLLHLPPALRTLHLDARKGRDSAGITDSNVPTIGRDRSPLSASTVDSTHGEGGPAAVRRGACRPEGEARGDYYNGTVQSSAGNYCCLQREGSDSRCETNEIVGVGVEGHRGVRLGGCERTHVAQWTERQRTMCLVPDVGGRTTSR